MALYTLPIGLSFFPLLIFFFFLRQPSQAWNLIPLCLSLQKLQAPSPPGELAGSVFLEYVSHQSHTKGRPLTGGVEQGKETKNWNVADVLTVEEGIK
jgi:hypothetical protein